MSKLCELTYKTDTTLYADDRPDQSNNGTCLTLTHLEKLGFKEGLGVRVTVEFIGLDTETAIVGKVYER